MYGEEERRNKKKEDEENRNFHLVFLTLLMISRTFRVIFSIRIGKGCCM